MGMALYRKYRSKSLDEIVGQSHITDMLQRAVKSGKIAHAYLLTGPKGVGKTSIARILAHEINQLPYTDESTHLDIIEIDAASNNSVEDVRDLREKVNIAPTSASKKIYIIDEVHMLSKQAFNALLKTLEEPPAHVVFILATTDADKLPATIISRVQRFNFRTIAPTDATKHLRYIADSEGIAIDDDALELIAIHGGGSFRDSIGLLDQLQHLSDSKITRTMAEQLLGLAANDMLDQLLTAYVSHDMKRVVSLLDTIEQHGTPATLVASQLIALIRRRIIEQPMLLPLLDALLDVQKSAWPHIKLLTALTSHMHTPTAAPQPAATAKQAPSEIPAMRQPEPVAEIPTPKPKTEPIPKPASKPTPTPTPQASNAPRTAPAAFDWDAFVTEVKSSAMGAYTILRSCGHRFDGGKLIIYAGKKFAKNKLDKDIAVMNAALHSLGYSDAEVEVLDVPKPPEDSIVASVIDLIGGGEEVTL